ncbi:MAG: ABC transporter permease [Candidatus Diapherotrites archaeon]|nr:ABC transporter permease [Candidatus Diapherotrites archaeon]
MKFLKCLKHAFNMIVHSKLRSWLTILGIIIGVSAVIAIVSIGEGLQQTLNSQLDGLSGDILTLTAGYSKSTSMFSGGGGGKNFSTSTTSSIASTEEIILSRKDVQALKLIPDIALIDTNIKGTVEISHLGKSGTVSLTGVDQKVWFQITNLEIKDGRMLNSADQNVIVIGGKLAESYFDKPLGINQMITIEENVFRIVGILDDSSTSIYLPIQRAYQLFEDKENEVYDSITIKIKDENQLDEMIEKIETKLMMVRHVNEKTKDFSILSNKQMQETRSEMMSSMSVFLIAIAAVSLIVGAIGIANTMFTSVIEKTKEIGIMKAIGARNKDIMLIFLLYAGLLGLVGGLIGTIFGIILSGAIPSMMGDVPMMKGGSFVSLNSIILALSVSVIVGILSGIVPAYQGSKLKPVDALRHD